MKYKLASQYCPTTSWDKTETKKIGKTDAIHEYSLNDENAAATVTTVATITNNEHFQHLL
jgi:hypothetical protein